MWSAELAESRGLERRSTDEQIIEDVAQQHISLAGTQNQGSRPIPDVDTG